MNVKIENFIGIYENAFDPMYCDQVVKYFNSMEQCGYGASRQHREWARKTSKDDVCILSTSEQLINLSATQQLATTFNEVFWNKCLPHYLNEYSVLIDSKQDYKVYETKIQKTKIGGGYHVWHFESSAPSVCRRILVYCLYLNDVEEGGETEFLYYPKRIKAKKGTLVIFPGGFTHTHRGNPPISNEKYLLNGWVEL